MALTSREIDLNEDEVVELIKVGCAGWWYVRITTYPYPEGWAPSTYLEKIAWTSTVAFKMTSSPEDNRIEFLVWTLTSFYPLFCCCALSMILQLTSLSSILKYRTKVYPVYHGHRLLRRKAGKSGKVQINTWVSEKWATSIQESLENCLGKFHSVTTHVARGFLGKTQMLIVYIVLMKLVIKRNKSSFSPVDSWKSRPRPSRWSLNISSYSAWFWYLSFWRKDSVPKVGNVLLMLT